jgi:alanine-glyoxylate transaminase / serine-glyoxylate transaminase / serine-pyruvate transaminase
MPNRLDTIPDVLLMGPGPSCVLPEVYRALTRPTLGHLDPDFIALMDETKDLLRQVMRTKNAVTLPLSATGSAGMEAAFANLVESGDRVLILVNGYFGTRMADMAGRLRANVETLDFTWGTPVDVAAVRDKLAGQDYRLVAIVHAETSTGVANPVAEVGRLVKSTGALYLVDCVTSLGGMPVAPDEWGADAVYSVSQKCLSCPPGLAPFSLSDRAVAKLRARKDKVPNWYLDISLLINYWDGTKRAYHHTAPINMIYGLYQALHGVLAEGLDAAFARHRAAHEQLVAGLQKLGLDLLVAPGCRLPMLNAVKVPAGVDEAAVRSRLRAEHKIEVGAGLGPLAGKIWRVGLMGHTARPENVERFLKALGTILRAPPRSA